MSGDKRFWYGVHNDGTHPSVVLWDRDNQPEARALGHYVLLYNLKANAFFEYQPAFIRHHVRGMYSAEWVLIDELKAGYFPALSRYKRDLHAEHDAMFGGPEDYDEWNGDSDPDYNEDGAIDPPFGWADDAGDVPGRDESALARANRNQAEGAIFQHQQDREDC